MAAADSAASSGASGRRARRGTGAIMRQGVQRAAARASRRGSAPTMRSTPARSRSTDSSARPRASSRRRRSAAKSPCRSLAPAPADHSPRSGGCARRRHESRRRLLGQGADDALLRARGSGPPRGDACLPSNPIVRRQGPRRLLVSDYLLWLFRPGMSGHRVGDVPAFCRRSWGRPASQR
jgi:hypothetical protein